VAREVVDLYRDSAAQQGIVLEADIDDSVGAAYIDPEGIHSCLANLIGNAVDACLVSDNKECSITVRLREIDDVIRIEVADSGCGMDYEVKQKVFTSFFTTKGKGGSGLGLLLTRKIVQQHGGSIELETVPGEGTTFRIEMPRGRLPKPEDQEGMNDA
jgi:signal transduction histidine kinase